MFENCGEGTCVVKKTTIPSVIKEVVCELSLPDYLPDVSRLLRTEAVVGAENGYVSGGALEYDGEINSTVIYATSDGRIKSVSLSSDFDGSLPLPEADGDIAASPRIRVDGVTCRLQNPRRLSVRVKLDVGGDMFTSICVSPVVSGKLTAEEEANIQRRTYDGESFCRVCVKDENIPVSEDIELDGQDASIGEIVSLSLLPYVYEVRAENGKLSYRGDVSAELIYLAATADEKKQAEYFSVRKKIPIAGSVDADGVTDAFTACGDATVTGVEFRPQANATGENRVAEVDFTYTAHLCAYSNRRVETVVDMYSTDYQCENVSKEYEMRRALRAGAFNFTSDGTSPLDEKGHDVPVAGSATVTVEKIEKNGSKAVFTGKTAVSVILASGDGSYVGRSFEYPFRAETEVGKSRGELECSASPSVVGMSARVDGGELKCDVEVGISFAAFEKEKVAAVSECVVMTDRPVRRATPASIVICYPSSEDDLWSVSKRYGTTESDIMKANSLTSEKLSGEALIIPSKSEKSKLF